MDELVACEIDHHPKLFDLQLGRLPRQLALDLQEVVEVGVGVFLRSLGHHQLGRNARFERSNFGAELFEVELGLLEGRFFLVDLLVDLAAIEPYDDVAFFDRSAVLGGFHHRQIERGFGAQLQFGDALGHERAVERHRDAKAAFGHRVRGMFGGKYDRRNRAHEQQCQRQPGNGAGSWHT